MAILIKPRTEGCHWYSANGEPVHTRPNASGTGEHNTTLADARKLGLFPSVTNILSVLAKHGLEKWKIQQVLLAMKRTRQKAKEADEVYFERVINEAFEQVDVAQRGGTGLHQVIMAALQGRPVEKPYRIYIDPIFAFFEKHGVTVQTTEQTIVNHEVGFAGTMDLAGFRGGDVPVVFDWKTRRTKPGRAITSYEVQPMQIAAYGATYWRSRWPFVIGGNIYVSSTEPGRIELIPYDASRMQQEYDAFVHCCEIWRHLNGYDPRTAGTAAETTGTELAKERFQNIVISAPVEGAPLLTEIKKSEHISDTSKMAIATPIAKPARKKAGDTKKAQKRPAPKPTKSAKTTSGKAVVDVSGQKPKFVLIPVGKFKGEPIHNVPKSELIKLLKFSRRHLAKHPGMVSAIERFLAPQKGDRE